MPINIRNLVCLLLSALLTIAGCPLEVTDVGLDGGEAAWIPTPRGPNAPSAPELLGKPATTAAALYDNLPLDDGDAARVGTLPGEFRVTDDGVATYSIRLRTPVGHATAQPELELRYASSGGDGLLGAGFSLRGLSTIARCSKIPVTDGVWRAVHLDDEDALCLDGTRLVLLEGDYFENGSVYRTEQDSFVRIRLERRGGVESFVAQHPSGRRESFGTTQSCRQKSAGIVAAWSLCRVEDVFGNYYDVEYESSVSDVVGNGRERADSTIEHRPAEIRMWGHGARASRPAIVFDYADRPDVIEGHMGGGVRRTRHRLTALREYDPDGALFRRYQLEYENGNSGRSRLASVTECGEREAVCMPSTRFTYTEAPVAYAQAEVDDVAFSGSLWPETAIGDGEITAMNVDGDAFDDLVFRDEVTETWHVWQGGPNGGAIDTGILTPDSDEMLYYPARYRGMHNNGPEEDILVVNSHVETPLTSFTRLLGERRADGTASFAAIVEPIGGNGGYDVPLLNDRRRPIMAAADFNGDGLQDLVICHGTEETSTWTFWESDRSEPTRHVRNPTRTQGRCDDDDFIVLDFDGDRAANLLRIDESVSGESGEYLALYQPYPNWMELPTGLPRDVLQRLISNINGSQYGPGPDIIIDLNGDGLPDVARLEPPDGDTFEEAFESGAATHQGGHVFSYINTGNGFRRGPRLWPIEDDPLLLPMTGFQGSRAIDVNLDGVGELIVFAGDTVAVRIEPSGVTGEYMPIGTSMPYLDGAGTLVGPFDFNADGLGDLVTRWGNGVVVPPPNEGTILPFLRTGPRPDLLTRIVDGYGAQIDIDYAPLRTIHDRDEECDDDLDGAVECVNDARPVVHFETHDTSAHLASTGGIIRRTIEHAYRDGRRHRYGRGWLGFAEHSYSATTDDAPDTLTRVQMDNHTYDAKIKDFPFAHRQRRVTRESEVVDARRTVIDEETRFEVYRGPEGRTWFAGRESIRTRHLEIEAPPGDCDPHQDCALDWPVIDAASAVRDTEVTHVYDEFGNIENTTSVRQGGSTSEIDCDFSNDTEHWFIGRQTSRVEESEIAGVTRRRLSLFDYDETTGALAESTVDPASFTGALITTIERDSHGNIWLSKIENRSPVWGMPSPDAGETRTETREYDALGVFPERTTNPAGHVSHAVFSYRHGGLRRLVDAGGMVVDVAYDGLGREKRRESFAFLGGPSSGVVSLTTLSRRNAGGPTTPSELRLVEETPGHEYSQTEHDRFGQIVSRARYDVEGDLVVQGRTYWPSGLLRSEELPHKVGIAAPGSQERFYDELGRRRRLIEADGGEWLWNYPNGLDETSRDPAGRLSQLRHDVEGHVVWSADHAGTATCYEYGPFGYLLNIKRGCAADESHWVKAEYDAYGRRISSDDPNEGAKSFEYDGFGLLTSMTDAGGVTSYQYDALGRQVRRWDDGAWMEWTWDLDDGGGYPGKLRSSLTPNGVLDEYEYDAFGRRWQERRTVDGLTLTTNYGRDALGREDRVSFPPSFGVPLQIRRQYDDHGNLISVENATEDQLLWYQLSSHPSGMVAEEGFGNGLFTWRHYNALSLRPESIVTDHDEGEFDVQGLAFSFAVDGLLESRGDAVLGQFETFEYDALGRLEESIASHGAVQFTVAQSYDAHGNLLSRTGGGVYEYDDGDRPDRVTAIGGDDVEYDSTGKILAVGDDLTLLYSVFDVPRQVVHNGVVTDYLYAPGGDRARRKSSADNSTTTYQGDYEVRRVGLMAQREHRYTVRANGRVVAEIVRSNFLEAGAPGPLGFIESTRYFHDDHLGSVDVITDEDGSVVQRLSFEAFGRARDSDWTNPVGPVPASPAVGFTGVDGRADGGMVAFPGRWYHPGIGRFISPDPLTVAPFEPLGLNRYVYAWNRPLTVTDRTGLAPAIGGLEGTRIVVVHVGGNSGGGWLDGVGDALREWLPTPESSGVIYSIQQVLNAAKAKESAWEAIPAAAETAAAEALAHASQGMEHVNNVHSGTLDATNPGITKAIREAVVPGVTDYQSKAYGVAYVAASIASLALAGAALVKVTTAASKAHAASRAAAAVSGTAQTAKVAGSTAAGTSSESAAQTYQIVDGVRRSKAAEIAAQQGVGTGTISADVVSSGKVVATVEVQASSLLSPKATISTSGSGLGRWMDTLRQTLEGSAPPRIQIEAGSRGTLIRDVLIE